MTANLTPEAREFVEQITAVPFEWWAGAIVVAIVGGIMAALVRAPLDDTAPLSRLDLMDRGCCGAISPEGWTCDRDADHDADTGHADSTKGAELGRARWFDGRAA